MKKSSKYITFPISLIGDTRTYHLNTIINDHSKCIGILLNLINTTRSFEDGVIPEKLFNKIDDFKFLPLVEYVIKTEFGFIMNIKERTIKTYGSIKNGESLIYAIGRVNKEGNFEAVKFGVSNINNFKTRFTHIKTANSDSVQIISTKQIVKRSEAFAIEKNIHTELKNYRINGEWFKYNSLVMEKFNKIINKAWSKDA